MTLQESGFYNIFLKKGEVVLEVDLEWFGV
jgi:hypothetical protein